MLSRVELLALIAQIRRAMPRNAPVMTLCDEIEHRIALASVDSVSTKTSRQSTDPTSRQSTDKRKAYQRDWIRRKRANGDKPFGA